MHSFPRVLLPSMQKITWDRGDTSLFVVWLVKLDKNTMLAFWKAPIPNQMNLLRICWEWFVSLFHLK